MEEYGSCLAAGASGLFRFAVCIRERMHGSSPLHIPAAAGALALPIPPVNRNKSTGLHLLPPGSHLSCGTCRPFRPCLSMPRSRPAAKPELEQAF